MIKINYDKCSCNDIYHLLGFFNGYTYSICNNCHRVNTKKEITKISDINKLLELGIKEQEICIHSWKDQGIRYHNNDYYKCTKCGETKIER